MQLDWKFNVQFAGLFIAQEAGLYQKAGLNVAFREWTDGVNVIELASRSSNMLTCGEQNLVIAAQADGLPIRVLATMLQAPPIGLMTIPGRPFKTLADLEGKTIGAHIDGIKVLDLVLGENNIPKDSVKIVEIPSDGKFARVVSGEFYAVQCYAIDEPIAVEHDFKLKPQVMRLGDFGFPSTAQTIVASDAMIAAQPDAIHRFLKASFKGWGLALADIAGSARMVATKYATPGGPYADIAYQTASLKLIKHYVEYGTTPATLGVINAAAWRRSAELMLRYGVVSKLPDMTQSLAPGFLP